MDLNFTYLKPIIILRLEKNGSDWEEPPWSVDTHFAEAPTSWPLLPENHRTCMRFTQWLTSSRSWLSMKTHQKNRFKEKKWWTHLKKKGQTRVGYGCHFFEDWPSVVYQLVKVDLLHYQRWQFQKVLEQSSTTWRVLSTIGKYPKILWTFRSPASSHHVHIPLTLPRSSDHSLQHPTAKRTTN